MPILHQLQDSTFQAYLNFKSNANNVAQVNSAYAKVIAAAQAVAQQGLYSVFVNLGDLDTISSNSALFQRYLDELLTNDGFDTDFVTDVQQSWVTINWDPEVLNS